mmetsp:Transcript_37554/g.112593  ORF Transcript_37554/g.112593 Transcript_37554/m.112593 type:complete len:287 (-) Transcript_37554:329-1189(-)
MAELSKKRVRKATDVYVPDVKPPTTAEKEAPVGKGARLEDLPNVVANFGAVTCSSPHLRMLHILALGVGKKREFKFNLFSFSGLIFPEGEKETEAARDKVRVKIMKLQLNNIKSVMDLADVERGRDSFEGTNPTKAMLADRLLEWLEEPRESGRNLRKMRTLKGAAKGGRVSGGGASTKKRKIDEEGGNSTSKKEEPKKNIKAAKSSASKKLSKTSAKVSPKMKLEIPGASVDQVRTKVKSIVQGADQQELTVKGVRKMLEDWLDCDLKEHKDAIRSLVMEAMNDE